MARDRSRTIQGARAKLKGATEKARVAVHGSGIGRYYEWLCAHKPSQRVPDFRPDLPHTKLIIRGIQRLADGETKAFMCLCPPQHGKTWTGVIMAILWVMLRYPGVQIIFLAHSEERAQDVSRLIRNIAADNGWLSETLTGVSVWAMNNGSQLKAFGAQQKILGNTADWIVADDVIGSRREAESPKSREMLKTWWESDVMSRRNMGTKIVFIYTPNHGGDLGYQLLKLDMGWELLRMPAMSEGAERIR
jgi:hypothetical protein